MAQVNGNSETNWSTTFQHGERSYQTTAQHIPTNDHFPHHITIPQYTFPMLGSSSPIIIPKFQSPSNTLTASPIARAQSIYPLSPSPYSGYVLMVCTFNISSLRSFIFELLHVPVLILYCLIHFLFLRSCSE